jgi:hypothetical protein
MASGVTHILLVKELVTRLENGDLKMTLLAGRDFLQVGAVAPDLPYASIADDDFFLTTQSELAEAFHYDRTNEVPLSMLQSLKQQWKAFTPKQRRYAFCFVAGYISHLVADGLVHPFVRDKVGSYQGNQTAHRVLEMQLDVLLYHHLTKFSGQPIELNCSNIHDELENLRGFYPRERDVVLSLFAEAIQAVYHKTYSVSTIGGWVTGLHRMFAVAEGDHPAIYRNIGFVNDFLFADYEELRSKYDSILTLRKPKDRAENFLHQPRVHFFDDIVPKFFSSFVPLLTTAYGSLYGSGPMLTEAEIPAIDLDTGRLLAAADLDAIPVLWA